ncbi:MAG: hypothetical protein KDD06_15345 [Phaeodactylibacter sp.]|nr:hypothetical protein [Phaeodactylibacter sp.]
MNRLPLLLAVAASCLPVYSTAQPSDIDTSSHCIYTSLFFSGTPYLSESSPRIREIVDEICTAAGFSRNFEVVAASVGSVAAVKDGPRYYLLYSRYYTRTLLERNPVLLYAILAHEIGHIARRHTLDGRFRLSEESSADEFMGRVLYELKKVNSIDMAITLLREDNFAYAPIYPPGARERIIRNGWNSIDGLVRSEGNLGYFENEANLENLTLPVFEIKGCPRFYDFPRSYFQGCKTLKEADHLICRALDNMGYEQRRYYSLPNGFALLTPVEQINAEGIALQGQERWQDYPSSNDFDGILNYLRSLVLPKPGYFRLFAFAITDQPVKSTGGQFDKKQARDWLENGGFWLPELIGNKAFDSGYHAGVFVYEFEAPQTTKKLSERCYPSLLSVEGHLDRSGILQYIKK